MLPLSAKDPRLADIMASGSALKTPDGGSGFSFLNLFPLPLPGSDGDTLNLTADLSAMTSMGPAVAAIDRLLGSKKFELTEAARKDFRTKLAVFVGRPELS
ncbi:hypothetical protein AYX19_08775 [Paenarthrobacter ureafaciens]|nr:hypothetical protein AYX19_08775 [Paenarthrobacter ureafaciens]